jgi:hypothetical protein
MTFRIPWKTKIPLRHAEAQMEPAAKAKKAGQKATNRTT